MKTTKNHISYFVLILMLLFLTGCKSFVDTNANIPDKNTLIVHYIDVGQADSILIQINGKNLLIDAGNRDDGDVVVSYLKAHGVEKINYVIATHPHEDHIGGMVDVIKKFPIEKFYAPKITTDTKTFENMVDALQDKDLKINTAKAGVDLNLGDNIECDFLSPTSSSYDDLNNYSSVLKITYGSTSFLFMGDAEKLVEKQLINSKADLSCDVLKVGHHGSSSSSSKDFLDKSHPKIAVISCGKDNDYNHPHKETIDELSKRNLSIYRTDKIGSIIIESDGKKVLKK